MLTNSPKILYITKGDFCNSISYGVFINYNKDAGLQISAVFRTVSHIAFPRVFWSGIF